MFRDAALVPQDAKVLKEMDMSVFCQETIRSYRQIFRNTHPNHVWNNVEDEIFLRCIGATAIGEDAIYHPTAAGLLMFGYEYEILREFPQYFLDYQENRQMLKTRWTDRIISSSGNWSGNVFDFVYKVIPKLTADLKVPFVLKRMQRIDDTPIHKILREATTNACVHSDFYGRRGLVITKNEDGFSFANPGGMRVAKNVAIDGGISDPRNGLMLKMFSLINYGERAGSGLNSIFYIWEHVYHTSAIIEEEMGVDRVFLKLNKGEHEQDVKAMIELYDNPEELTFEEDVPQNSTQNQNADKRPINLKTADKWSIKKELTDKWSITTSLADKLADIVIFATDKKVINTEDVVALLSVSDTSAKRYLRQLTEYGYLAAEGGNKNRTYHIIADME